MDYPDRKCVAWPAALAESAELVFPVERTTGATSDPDDEMILECALAAEADFIVSGDKKHLLALRQFRGIPIVSPAELLRHL
jgi:predicted nucleic acid-binding protein